MTAVAIAGLGTGGWFLGTHLVSHRTGQSASPEKASQAAVARSTAPAIAATPAVSPDPAPTLPQAAGTVTIGPAAAQDPSASAVADLLSRYFAAINNHDYQAYNSLMVPQSQITAAQFDSGYRSTADSAETLTGISAAGGDTEADVTFTSHQNPADSADGTESCTDWTISLYLLPNGGSYLIDQPPSSYHASYAPC